MFCAAVSCGSRLKDWKTNPIRSRRTRVSVRSDWPVSSVPPSRTRPEVAVSRPARQCISVDLPDPDEPMIAVNSARPKPTETPSRARTAVSPLPYTFTRSTAATAAWLVSGGAWVVIVPPVAAM